MAKKPPMLWWYTPSKRGHHILPAPRRWSDPHRKLLTQGTFSASEGWEQTVTVEAMPSMGRLNRELIKAPRGTATATEAG